VGIDSNNDEERVNITYQLKTKTPEI